jgi:hypothetical protein
MNARPSVAWPLVSRSAPTMMSENPSPLVSPAVATTRPKNVSTDPVSLQSALATVPSAPRPEAPPYQTRAMPMLPPPVS